MLPDDETQLGQSRLTNIDAPMHHDGLREGFAIALVVVILTFILVAIVFMPFWVLFGVFFVGF